MAECLNCGAAIPSVEDFCSGRCQDQYNRPPAATKVRITEMRVCEIAHLILHPGQLYRFTVDENCAGCRAYGAPKP